MNFCQMILLLSFKCSDIRAAQLSFAALAGWSLQLAADVVLLFGGIGHGHGMICSSPDDRQLQDLGPSGPLSNALALFDSKFIIACMAKFTSS
jgi:hypothetical protein